MIDILTKINPNLVTVFVTFGAIFFVLVFAIFFANIWVLVNKKIHDLIYIYQYKHRFGKPPLAKCYCKDCESWYQKENDTDEGTCSCLGGRVTADCWFCWDAKPKFKE